MGQPARLAGQGPALVFDLAEATPGAGPLLLGSLHQRYHAAGGHAAHPPAHAAGSLAAPPRLLAPAPLTPPARGAQPGAAARLNQQLRSVEGQLEQGAPRDQPAGAAAPAARDASLRARLGGLALRVGDMLQPAGEAPGDDTWGERASNVLTSLPFLALGWHMHRQRLTPEGRHHAASMMAVGVAATAYHATSGALRRTARKVDYWTIAYTSSAMTRALFADSPGVRRAASLSLLALPFRPFHVSTAHTLLMQAEFARQARHSKAVARDLRRHYAAAALGVAAFFGEDAVAGSGYSGFVHSAWHCLATYSMFTLNGLLAHNERQLLRRRLAGRLAAASGAAKPLRRPLHSSASSLPSVGGGKLAGGSPGSASP